MGNDGSAPGNYRTGGNGQNLCAHALRPRRSCWPYQEPRLCDGRAKIHMPRLRLTAPPVRRWSQCRAVTSRRPRQDPKLNTPNRQLTQCNQRLQNTTPPIGRRTHSIWLGRCRWQKAGRSPSLRAQTGPTSSISYSQSDAW